MVGGKGEPSLFLARNPALKRLCFGLGFSEGTGGAGIGDEPFSSDSEMGSGGRNDDIEAARTGEVVSPTDDISGLCSVF